MDFDSSNPRPNTNWVLAVSVLGSSLGFIDSSVVNIALPAIQQKLSTDLAAIQWVSNGYMLSLASLVLLGGGIGDRIGTLRAFRIGLLIFVLASAGCGLASTVSLLITARIVQGVGAALLMPTSLALVSQAYTGKARGKAIGTWSAEGGMLLALGPPLGGWLVDVEGWRSIFFINVPVAVLAIGLSFKIDAPLKGSASNRLDYLGSVLAVLSLGMLTFGLIELGEGGLKSGLISLCVALVALIIFLAVEAGSKAPLVPLRLFRDTSFAGVNVMTVILYGALGGALFMIPFLLINLHHYTPSEAGLSFLPLSAILGMGSRFSGRLSTRTGPRPPLIFGPLITALGFVALGLLGSSPNYWLGVLPGLALIGIGMTVAVPALTTTVFDSAPDADNGAASGINNAAARTGGLLAVAALGIAFGTSDLSTIGPVVLFKAYRTVMFSAACAAVVSAICAAVTISPKEDA